jgi:hypothetical protein
MIPALCGQWDCRLCGPQRCAWLRRQIEHAITAHNLTRFWTLTLRTAGDPVDSYNAVTDAWERLRKALHRPYGAFSFVWTVEPTQQGYAHLHILTNLDIADTDLSRRWRKATGNSWQVSVGDVYSQGVAAYIVKDATRLADMRLDREWAALRGKRVFSKSQDITFQTFKQKSATGGWRLWDRSYWAAAAALRDKTMVVQERTTGVPRIAVVDTLTGGVPTSLVVPIEPAQPSLPGHLFQDDVPHLLSALYLVQPFRTALTGRFDIQGAVVQDPTHWPGAVAHVLNVPNGDITLTTANESLTNPHY